MTLALYEPGLGYYSAGARKLGAAGDFITAPEVAPVFSRCLAVQCAEVLGTLAAERRGHSRTRRRFRRHGGRVAGGVGTARGIAGRVLDSRRQCGPARASARDAGRRRAAIAGPRTLARHLARVILAAWSSQTKSSMRCRWSVSPSAASRSTRWASRRSWADSNMRRFARLRRLNEAVRRIESDLGRLLPDGYVSEVCLGLAPWLASIAERMTRGVMLLIDYGLPRREYYSAERTDGTLLCHFRHRFHDDPFARLGLQDITAWVDFTAVADAAVQPTCTWPVTRRRHTS